jgi:arylsulfatase A-like enzyme
MPRRTTFTLVAVTALAAACGKDKPSTSTSAAEAAPTAAPGATGGATAPGTPATPDKPKAPPAKAAARGPEYSVYSLVDSRLTGHLQRGGGLVVPAGSAAFAKYMRFGNQMGGGKKAWELRQTEGDIKVARMNNKSGTVFVPLTSKQASRGTLRARIFAQKDGAVSVRVNDNKDINGQLTKGWSTLEVKIPDGQLHEGENAIALFAGSGSELAWMQVGHETATGDDGSVRFYDTGSKSLLIPQGGGMSWFAAVPDKAKLTVDITDGNCTLDVLVTGEDGKTVEGKLTGTGSAVDLADMGGKAARIDLTTTGCAEAQVPKADLVVAGTLPTVKRGEPPKHVLFVIMDSLRADRIKVFNPKARPDVPNWEKLAETSAVFLDNYVQGNESQVSHASMWTSAYLAKHKAKEMKDHIAEKFFTIDEVAKKAGKYAAGVSANGYIRPGRGFGNSWDQFVNHIEKSLGLKGVDVMEKGVSFITPKKDQPWFLYIGMIDTHVTWRAKSPWIEKYDPGYKGKYETQYGDDGKGGFGKNLSDKEKNHIRAIYDSNVSYQDDLLGKLVAKLQEWGIYDQTMIIVTADHGDEQWEDGDRVGHAGSQRETVVHVPLIIHYPPMFPASKITAGTEGIDIVPTLADVLGVPMDAEWQGTSLLPYAHGAAGAGPSIAISSAYENMHCGRIGDWKLQLKGGGTPRLWNLGKDPDEHKDMFGSAPIAERMLLDPMWMYRTWNVEWKKSQWGNPASVSSRFAADLGE